MSIRRLLWLFGLVVIVLMIGTIGYMLIEEMDFFSALYMTVITVSTVGFSEVKPLSTQGRVWTMFMILLGWGLVSVAIINIFTSVFSWVVRFELGRYIPVLKRRVMRQLSNHCIVCGFGRTGEVVASFLHQHRVPFVVIDRERERVRAAWRAGYLAIHGNATEERTLKQAQIDRARALATLLPADPDNLYVALTARALNPGLRIIAISFSRRGAQMLRRAGVHRVISPLEWVGIRVGQALTNPVIADFIDHFQVRVEEIQVQKDSPILGKTLQEILLDQALKDVHIVALVRNGELLIPPPVHTQIQQGDVLLVLGKQSAEGFPKLEWLASGGSAAR